MPTPEQLLLAEAILRHRPFSLAEALQRALVAAGEYVPLEEETQLQQYADAIDIDMVSDGYRYVTRNGMPLLGLGSLELFTVPHGAAAHALRRVVRGRRPDRVVPPGRRVASLPATILRAPGPFSVTSYRPGPRGQAPGLPVYRRKSWPG